MHTYETAANAHNLDAMFSLIAEDAVFLFSNQAAHIGKAAIGKAIAANFAAIKAESCRISNLRWLSEGADTAV
jgi:ketosteroid isomerase-like protein